MIVQRRPTALVTGASRAIGTGFAVALANAGYDVAITARSMNAGDATALAPETGEMLPGSPAPTAAAITRVGGRAASIRLDLLELDTLADVIGSAVAHFINDPGVINGSSVQAVDTARALGLLS